MSRLTEKFIQKKALEYLQEYYQEKFHPTTIYAREEVRTNSQFHNKRADGLLCFNCNQQMEYTVSLEAKSHKTLGSLSAYWNDNKMALHALMIAIPLGLLSIIFSHPLAWYWISLISLGVFLFFYF